jgi:phosphoribosylformylglycinamidine cyclo-ligase
MLDSPAVPDKSSYREAGVNIDAQDEALREVRHIARGTFTPEVVSDIGLFGGLFRANFAGLQSPILVSSTDGVGTKLRIAQAMKIHDTVGYDLVCHCVNDILVQGARPLFFLDYLATGHLSPDVAEQVIAGVAKGCRDNGCALLGGETAEMPGFYADGEYDIAGFIVGIVDRERVINGAGIVPGDVLIGLPSAGLHTNGYSLARRVFFETCGYRVDAHVKELGGTVGDVLLAPHRSYLRVVSPLLDDGLVKGMAHITGGGITENLPRVLPDGCAAMVDPRAWPPLPVFLMLQDRGGIATDEMFRAFNMGIGLILVCAPEHVDRALHEIRDAGELSASIIGHIVGGDRVVHYAR